MTKNTSTPKAILALTIAAAASGAQAYELKLGTNMPPLDFHGFASQGLLASTKYDYMGYTKSGSIKFTEAGVNVSMNPFPRTHITAQGFLYDVGKGGGYDPVLDYALADYNFSDKFGIRAGRIIRPEGIYNSIQSIDLARTSVLLPQGMYDARWRDFTGALDGGSVYGNIGLGKLGSASYEVYGGMADSLSERGGPALVLKDVLRNPPTVYNGVNGFPETGFQIWWNTPLEGLRAGASLTKCFGFSYDYQLNIPPAFGGGAYTGVVDALWQHYSLEYQWKSWTFQAEYRYEDDYVHNEIGGIRMPTTLSAKDTWYINASYRVNNWLEVGAYYSEFYADVTDRNGSAFNSKMPAQPSSDAYQRDLALSFRFDPKPWWIIKLEGHYIHGTALLNDGGNNPVRNGDGWFMLAVKTTVSF